MAQGVAVPVVEAVPCPLEAEVEEPAERRSWVEPVEEVGELARALCWAEVAVHPYLVERAGVEGVLCWVLLRVAVGAVPHGPWREAEGLSCGQVVVVAVDLLLEVEVLERENEMCVIEQAEVNINTHKLSDSP